ncbi:MAG: YolD-like family protein [Clostridia bacterium]|nr:YolD-like family protein [Clostridia bacterium]
MSMEKYASIIDRQYPFCTNRAKLSRQSRAAQFSPFAALTGYGDAIEETARMTDRRSELDEETMQLLNCRISYIMQNINLQPFVTVTYFKNDGQKSGGEYLEYSGRVKRIDMINGKMFFTDGQSIEFRDIYGIESGIFTFISE